MSPLVDLPTNPNRTKNKSHSNNYDIDKEDNEVSWTEKMPSTNPNCTKSKSHSDICSKNHYNISDEVDIQELLSDNSKGPINNCDIGRIGDEMIWTKKMPSTDPNCTESKSHSDNCDSNHNGNRIGSEEQ